MFRANWLLCVLTCGMLTPLSLAWGQEAAPAAEKPAAPAVEEKPAADPAAPTATEAAPAAAEPAKQFDPAAAEKAQQAYEAKLDEWRSVLKDLRKVKTQFSAAGDDEREKFESQWNELLAKGNKIIPELRDLGLAAYEASPNTDPQLSSFLEKLAADAAASDHYDTALKVAQAMIAENSDIKDVWLDAAVAAYATNHFAKSDEYLTKAKEMGLVPEQVQPDPMASVQSMKVRSKEVEYSLPEYLEFWPEEEKLRQAEAEKDDLPRVKLETTKGTIVVELFENEAPNTVANFVSLVEAKFYDGLTFHRVIANFMAQGGCPNGDGTGGPGYHIPCECYGDVYRRHFEGTLSMAHAGKDTGGSQFFITFLPTPALNGRHTAFGRVIEGMDVLAELQRRNPQDPTAPAPDKIVKAEVIRKRDHEYKPKKVETDGEKP